MTCTECGEPITFEKSEPTPGKSGRRHKPKFGCKKITVKEFRRLEKAAAQKAQSAKKAKWVPVNSIGPVGHTNFGKNAERKMELRIWLETNSVSIGSHTWCPPIPRELRENQ